MTAMTAETSCPECGGEMWDNRQNKLKPGFPDFKCKDKACAHAIWLEKKKNGAKTVPAKAPVVSPAANRLPADSANALQRYLELYTVCFNHAATLAKSEEVDTDVAAMAATIYIQLCKANLA